MLDRWPTIWRTVDEVALARLVTRCEQVIVIEPRPGVVEAKVLAVAEHLRQQGRRPGLIWGRTTPPASASEPCRARRIKFANRYR